MVLSSMPTSILEDAVLLWSKIHDASVAWAGCDGDRQVFGVFDINAKRR